MGKSVTLERKGRTLGDACGSAANEPDEKSAEGDEGRGDADCHPSDFGVEFVFFGLESFLFVAKFTT